MSLFNKKYFDKPLSQGFVSIFIGRTIVAVATALLGIFLPIFLYDLFNQSFVAVVIYFGLGNLIYGLTVAGGAKFLNTFGFRRALRFSVFFSAAFYAFFYFTNQGNWIYFIPATIIVLTVFRLLYWVPYHTDIAKFTDKKNRGRQLSALSAIRLILGIFVPFIAGVLIVQFGFNVLFVIAIILHLVSGIPYLVIPKTNENFTWSISETWRQFLSQKRRKMMMAYAADGAENVIGLVIWPIFIYQLLNGDYFKVGTISTLIIGITVIVQLCLGKIIDHKTKKEKVLKWGSIFYSIGWLVKIFIATAFHIFIAGVYHNVTSIFLRTPFDTLSYEIAADGGHYVDEFTVIREMAVNFGKVFMSALVIVFSFYLPIQWLFVLAAVAAILLNLLSGQRMERI